MDKQKTSGYSPLLPVLIAVIIIALVYYVISPFVNSVKELNTDLIVKAQEITAMEEKINDLKIIKDKFEQDNETLDLLNTAMPQDEEIDSFLVQLSQMADNASLIVDSIQPGEKDTEGMPTVTISVQGDYENVALFIEYLENNVRPLTIKSIDISSDKSGKEISIVSATIEIEIFTVGKSQPEEMMNEDKFKM